MVKCVLIGVSSAIFFVPGFLLFIPGGKVNIQGHFTVLQTYVMLFVKIVEHASPLFPAVYHVIYISCAVRGRRGFKLFYLPYFEK